MWNSVFYSGIVIYGMDDSCSEKVVKSKYIFIQKNQTIVIKNNNVVFKCLMQKIYSKNFRWVG